MKPASPDKSVIPADTYRRIVAAKMFIDENFHQAVNLRNISAAAYISPYRFHRMFRGIYQVTPHRYLTTVRLRHAIRLLEEHRPVSEVCNKVGFDSHASFSILFRKEFGFAPTYYRNQAWLRKLEAKAQPEKFIPHCFIDGYSITQ
ncbi:MAG TPA: AraC family transcriptional regulator [Chitinophagaceae bacterium]|jgi:AraC-like DNA-binding protein